MRYTDIKREYTPEHHLTQRVYMPGNIPAAEMPIWAARRGMCPRSQGRTDACRNSCQSPCRFGKRVMEIEEGGKDE